MIIIYREIRRIFSLSLAAAHVYPGRGRDRVRVHRGKGMRGITHVSLPTSGGSAWQARSLISPAVYLAERHLVRGSVSLLIKRDGVSPVPLNPVIGGGTVVWSGISPANVAMVMYPVISTVVPYLRGMRNNISYREARDRIHSHGVMSVSLGKASYSTQAHVWHPQVRGY